MGNKIICLDCGNTKKFEKEYNILGYGTETVLVDGNDEQLKIIGEDWHEVDRRDMEEIICCNCQSSNIEMDLSEKMLLEIQVEHTNKQGKWYQDELLEKSWNPKLVKKLAAVSI